MSNEIVSKITDSIVSADVTDIKNSYEVIRSLIAESFMNSTVSEAKKQFRDFYKKEDRVIAYLKPKGNMQSLHQFELHFYYGQIVGLLDLLADMARRLEEQQEIHEIAKKSKYLFQCLHIVNTRPGIPGKELKQELKLSDSSFSNFFKRIEPYNLLYIQKIGNTNYYSLTPRGRRSLQLDQTKDSSKQLFEEGFIVSLLEAIADEYEEDKPEAARVIIRASRCYSGSTVLGNSILVKNAINRILRSNNFRLKKILVNSTIKKEKKYISSAGTTLFRPQLAGYLIDEYGYNDGEYYDE